MDALGAGFGHEGGSPPFEAELSTDRPSPPPPRKGRRSERVTVASATGRWARSAVRRMS